MGNPPWLPYRWLTPTVNRYQTMAIRELYVILGVFQFRPRQHNGLAISKLGWGLVEGCALHTSHKRVQGEE